MNVSARNVFEGRISAITLGEVNAEVELALPGDVRLVAVLTEASCRELGLTVGNVATAYVKAPWVMLCAGRPVAGFSARNQLPGTVSALRRGAVSTEVTISLDGGAVVHAVVTNEAALELALKLGEPATALIKASHVIVGVPA